MKVYVLAGLLIIAVLASSGSYAVSAQCVIVEKRGSMLVMDCGARSKGFDKGTRVKIKTDRDNRNNQ